MENRTIVTCCALIVLCIIEVAAISRGMNGQILLVVLVIVAGMVGVPVGSIIRGRVQA